MKIKKFEVTIAIPEDIEHEYINAKCITEAFRFNTDEFGVKYCSIETKETTHENKTCGECKYYKPYNEKICLYVHRQCVPRQTKACNNFASATVFDKITESVETLAPCFVEKQPDKWGDDDYPYYSYLTKEWYATEDKAIAATVEELKKEWSN